MAALPQPRELLTSLINEISSIPLSQPGSNKASIPGRQETPFHPLKAVPPSHRHLLTTLHVLFPTLLLPALDLLDRGLVNRLVVDSGVTPGEGGNNLPGEPRSTTALYIVRSARPVAHYPRRQQAQPPPGNSYAVRLHAWNCSCAAFAFAAYPTVITVTGAREGQTEQGGRHGMEPDDAHGIDDDDDSREEGDEKPDLQAEDEPRWSFGGASHDGRRGLEGEGVPCCKHLLACLLADRWDAALGGYVEERRVGKEEMAGIVADV